MANTGLLNVPKEIRQLQKKINKLRTFGEKIGFLDIEASNLHATFGIVFTYCIKELSGKLLQRSVTIKDLQGGLYDKNLLNQLIKDFEQFDRIVVYYGVDRRFDLPFLRTRAEYWKLDFPEYKILYCTDVYNIIRNKFKFHSNRLGIVCDFFKIPAKKHPMKPEIWGQMITCNVIKVRKALTYILKHNIEDVLSLEGLWKRVNKYCLKNKTSI